MPSSSSPSPPTTESAWQPAAAGRPAVPEAVALRKASAPRPPPFSPGILRSMPAGSSIAEPLLFEYHFVGEKAMVSIRRYAAIPSPVFAGGVETHFTNPPSVGLVPFGLAPSSQAPLNVGSALHRPPPPDPRSPGQAASPSCSMSASSSSGTTTGSTTRSICDKKAPKAIKMNLVAGAVEEAGEVPCLSATNVAIRASMLHWLTRLYTSIGRFCLRYALPRRYHRHLSGRIGGADADHHPPATPQPAGHGA